MADPRLAMPGEILARCRWCAKRDRKASDWEQEHLSSGEWSPLCVTCAQKRLRNPWNALLPMRKRSESATA